MSSDARLSRLPPVKLALAGRDRVPAALPWLTAEPIAVVGLGCRLPGADGPEEFLAHLRGGEDAVRELPAGRWDRERYYDPDPDAPGKTYVTRGGYLDDVRAFDAGHFGVAPAEALRMDPQQRLLLEVSWHALEHAAIAPQSLYGTQTGVFFGVSSGDYASLLRRTLPSEELDGYVATGNAFSVTAGRVSYVLGLKGPSLAVDTACSSSLVSVHLAMQSLRLRECDVALSGGVNLLLEPYATVSFAKARMLAPDGRTKAFDARANGFVRGEGCGVLVLKRLSDAVAAGDDVWAVLRGSAVNQDGASSGLTAPNGSAQRAVLRAALAAAAVEPHQVGFVEAHGTGTALGDPIELGALAEVYGAGRPKDQPLRLGSVKASIGHLESAAGVAGLVKVVLALRHRELPGQLHFEQPNPHIDWDSSGLEVVRQPRPFSPIEGRWLAAVSSFGFSGTNAHVILEAAPDVRPPESRWSGPHTLVLGAHDAQRVDALAQRWADALAQAPAEQLPALVRTAWVGRDRGPERIAVSGADGAELSANLRAAVAGTAQAGAARGRVRRGAAAGKLAFLFSGQGAAWVGMGQALCDREPVFREVVARCAAVFGERAVLDPARIEGAILDTGAAQPALFTFEVAMAALLRSRGIEPDYVLGHSVGELAAACVAGVLELEQAARLVRERAEHMSALPGGGKMVALVADPAQVARAVRAAGADVSVAAFNGPRQVVVSGVAAAVDALVASLDAEDARALPVSHAFHSRLMDPVLPALRQALASVSFRPPRIPLVSSHRGALAGSELGRPDYWERQLREPVRFGDALETLWTAGVQEFVEVGPGAALVGLTRHVLADDPGVLAVPTATRRRGELGTLMDAVAALAVRRAERDLGPWLGEGPRSAQAPRTPLQRREFWPAEQGAPEAQPNVATRAARLPPEQWGWAPSFRRLRPPPGSRSGGPVAVVGDDRADAVAALLAARCVPVVRVRLEPDQPLDLDLGGASAPARVVIMPPTLGQSFTAWASALARALVGVGHPPHLCVLTTGAYEVTGAEPRQPSAAAVAAASAVLGQELAGARTRLIDLDPAAPRLPPVLVDELLADPDAPHAPRVVAYRGPHRWALDYVQAPLVPIARADEDAVAPAPAAGGTFVIVGRLAGGLGERIAAHLLRGGARRVVTMGTGLSGDPAAARTAQTEALDRLRAIAATSGDRDDEGRLVARAVDVGDVAALSAALSAVEAEHGPIAGVIHAGSSGRPEVARVLVQDLRPAIEELVRERVDGMAALAGALGARTPRYVLVVTSLSAHVGGVGFADYAAVNAYAEAFVAQHARTTGTAWFTVAFEALQQELGHGLERLDEGSALRRLALSEEDLLQSLDRLGLLPTEGTESPPSGNLLIVPTDAARRVEQAYAPGSVSQPPSAVGRAGALGTVAPRDDVESALMAIWEEFLPARPIGVEDDYFALGGTSLAAVQILSRLRARFSVEVPLEALLGGEPTIAAVAVMVRQQLGRDRGAVPAAAAAASDAPADDDAELEELLRAVEQLSPDEAEHVLAAEALAPARPARITRTS